MSKQEAFHSSLPSNSEGSMTTEGRYYVQVLTEHIFIVRECCSRDGKPGSDDIIVRSFDVRYDAYHYANSMNK